MAAAAAGGGSSVAAPGSRRKSTGLVCLSLADLGRLEKLFQRVDSGGSKRFGLDECLAFWKGDEHNAKTMMADLDREGSGVVTIKEWLAFFSALKETKGADEFERVVQYIEAAKRDP